MDKFTTKFLNNKYKIRGFRVGRKKGKLITYPLKKKSEFYLLDEAETEFEVSDLQLQVEILTKKVKHIEDFLLNKEIDLT